MKLKLLFFMGILSVLFNTMNGQNTAPVFQVAPTGRTDCPGYIAANIQFQVTDANTPATQLVVTASAVGGQAVTFNYSQDPTGILRAIDVIPVGPVVPGVVTVTLTLTDTGSPNLSSTAVFALNYEDITPPVISTSLPLPNMDVNVSSTASCEFTVPDYTGLIVATDYCAGFTKTQSPVAGSVLAGHNTTQTITLFATDDYGNATSTSFDITLKDVDAPIVNTKDITVQLDGSGNVTILPSDIDNMSTDNCTIVNYSLDKTAFSCANVGLNTVVLTVTDGAGNTASATATVTVEDKVAPVITCPANITVSNDLGTCSATVAIVDATATDNCSIGLTVVGSRSDSLLLTDSFPKGTTTIVWTATDASGNSSSCSQTVMVNDTEIPNVVTKNITVQLDASGAATIAATQIDNNSTDNCAIASSILDITSFTCANIGPNTVTLTVTDTSGNVASGTATVTIEDKTPPTVNTQNITVSLDGSGNVSIIPSQIDNGSTDNCGAIASLVLDITSFDCADTGANTVTLTVTDAAGNSATNTATVTVVDDIAPVITCPANITVSNDLGTCSATVAIVDATATDNCSIGLTVVGSRSDSLLLTDSFPKGTTTIVWTATDASGNSSSCSQTVMVNDTEIPNVVTKNITVQLDASGAATIAATQIDNNSTDNCAIASSILDITSFTCANIGPNTVTLTVTDTSGNVASGTATVTIEDKTPPTVNTQNITVSLDGSGNVSIIPSQIDNGSTDNCGAIASLVLDITSFDCADTGANTVTLTVTDAAGNSATNTATVTVVDDIAPVITCPANITVSNDLGTCSATVAIVDATATDNCSIGLTVVGSRSDSLLLTDSFPKGTTTIVWTATDASGNSSSCSQTVTVNDTQAPTVLTQNKIVYLDSMGNASITILDINNGSTDNCTIVSLSLNTTSFTCADLGNNTVTLTAIDDSGNTGTNTATVTVIDNSAPVITTNGDKTVNNDLGHCGAMVTVSATATDNCTSVIPTGVRSDSPLTLSDEYPVGTTTIVWTAIDGSGNVATTTQTVTVNDVEAPVFASLFSDLTVNNDPGLCSYATSQLPVPSVSDNCTPFSGIVTVDPAIIPVSAGPDHIPSIVTWTATDNYGNTVTATQNVTVQDLELPIMRTKNIIKYFDANGQITILPSDIDDGSTDNSGTLCFTKVVVPNILYCGNKGDNSVVLTGTDLWGNQHYKEATVTAVDNTNPTFVDAVLPAIELNTNTACTWVGSLAVPATADNCSVVSVTNDAPGAFPIGDTTVTWTVTDASGNSATNTQIVTVSDVEKPVMLAKLGVVVTLDNTGNATITAADVDNGSSDNCGIDELVVSPNEFNCSNIGDNVVTLTATDINGNSASIDVLVTVKDATNPSLVTKSFTAALSSTGVVTVLASDIVDSSSDNCGIKSTVVSPNTFTCANLGNNTVSVTVTDNNGNVTVDTAVVTVVDTTNPTISVTNITVNTNSGCTWNGTLALPVTADNCSVASVTSDKASSFAYPVGVTTVNWTVTDAAGNTANAVQTVTVNDVEKPIALANDFTVTLDTVGSATITAAQVNNNSSDNCGIVSYAISKSSFDCTNVGPNTVVLTVTDNSGNVSTVNATVTVQDSTVPVVTTKPYTLQLNAAGNGSIVVADVNNGSNDACGIKSMTVSPNSFTCANVGLNTVTLTVTDNNNNVSIGTAIVTVVDSVVPVVVTKPYTVQLSASGTASIIASDVNNGSSDACGIKSMTVSPSSFTCANVGSNTVTLTVTDNNNNVSIGTATVTVQDKVAPIVIAKSISLNLNASGTVSITPADVNDGSSDACGIASYSLSKSTFNCSNIGLNSVILTATDVNGNVSLPTTVLVTVSDGVTPTVNTKDITVSLNVSGTATIVAADVNNGSTDACGIASYSLNRTSFSCTDVALSPISVTLTVIDIHGNISTGTALVTVVDQIKPVARTRNITVQLGHTGSVAILASDINNGSTDNCSIASYTLSKSTFDCTNVGINTITLTAIDASGNNSIPVNATVTVLDNEAPVVITKNITVPLNASGTVTIVPADVNNGSTDNCSIATYSLSQNTFTCANVGQNVISLTATDASGNSKSAFATVTVQDVTAPVVVTKNIELVLDHGSVSIVPEDVLVSATDACGVDVHSYSLSKDTFTIVDVLASPVTITVYVTDVNGNVGSATATVTFPTNPTTAAQVITPNGDGINDTWVVDNITNHQNSVVRVFNRWGSLVYSAKNYQNDWDGKLNGSDSTVPDGGSYYYQIDLDGTGKVDSEGWLFISRQ